MQVGYDRTFGRHSVSGMLLFEDQHKVGDNFYGSREVVLPMDQVDVYKRQRLTRTGILWSMLSPESDYPARELAAAWQNVLLFSEHTWGASASGPDPYSQFTKDLWAGKKMYADSADVQSRRLCDEAMAGITAGEGYVQVLNTNLWPRTDVVTVAADLTGKRLLAPSGEPVEMCIRDRVCTLPSVETHWPFTSLHVLRLQIARYMLL